MTRKCEDCTHFVKTASMFNVKGDQGECHRFPPQVIGMPQLNRVTSQVTLTGMTMFPVVNKDCSGCGEFQRRVLFEEQSVS